MRAIGKNPTEDEILELVMETDLNGNGTLDFEEFVEMMKKKTTEEDAKDVNIYWMKFTLSIWKIDVQSMNIIRNN